MNNSRHETSVTFIYIYIYILSIYIYIIYLYIYIYISIYLRLPVPAEHFPNEVCGVVSFLYGEWKTKFVSKSVFRLPSARKTNGPLKNL